VGCLGVHTLHTIIWFIHSFIIPHLNLTLGWDIQDELLRKGFIVLLDVVINGVFICKLMPGFLRCIGMCLNLFIATNPESRKMDILEHMH
jgi:hypothetical protein